MNKKIFVNVIINLVLMVVFVGLNNWALQNGFEETFVSLTIIYGIVTIVANAFFVKKYCKK